MSDQPDDMPPYFGAPGFSNSYAFELLLNKPPSLDLHALLEQAGSEMPIEEMVSAGDGKSAIVSLGYPDRPIRMRLGVQPGAIGDKMLPAMTNLAWSDTRIKLSDYKSALDQTWGWDGARKALGRCYYKMIVADITGSRLPYPERFRRLTKLVAACIRVTDPHVVFWKEAGCLVEPARFTECTARFCNVRMYEVGIGGDHHMDTLGLAAIGLPDVELTFSKIDPGAVAAFLYRTAEYLFERGDVIHDGDTVPGPEDEHWKTAHDVATFEPARTVVRVTVSGRYAPTSATRN